jgi:hypothetical protein
MRSSWKVPALSLVVVLASCGAPQQPPATVTDDLKRDLAAASASTELAPAPKSYERARFVSPIEQSRADRPSARPTRAPQQSAHVAHDMTAHRDAPAPAAVPASQPAVAEAVATLESEAPAAVATPAASAPEPSVVIVQGAPREPEPIRVSVGRPGTIIGDDGLGGLGGVIGPSDGIAGGSILRGGHGGVDKCDPRTHGRPAMPTSSRPTFRMPSFPSGRR